MPILQADGGGAVPKRTAPFGITVVIPVRNNLATIDVQLEALALQDVDGPWEVLVVDNGSTDGIASALDRHPLRDVLRLRYVPASSTPGECHARNVGVGAAAYPFIACCDADDAVSIGWLTAMRHEATRYDVVGGPLEKTTLNDSTVAAWRDVFEAGGLPTCGDFLPFAQGCNTGFWKSAWETIGGFDETLIAGGGDIEFCWRAQLAGLTIGYAPDALVAYRFRTDMRESWHQVVKYGRGQAAVVARYRHDGASRQSVRHLVEWLGHIVVTCPVFPWSWSRARVGAWIWSVGGLWGCLSGGARHRFLYF